MTMMQEYVPITFIATYTHMSECRTSSSRNYRFALTDVACQQLLDHMKESMVYSEADLGPFQKRLAELRQIVQDDAANHPPAMIELLERKLGQCGMYLCRLACPSHVHYQPLGFSPHVLPIIHFITPNFLRLFSADVSFLLAISFT